MLVSVGVVFNRFNRDDNDYFRNGCKASWWMIGTSSWMTSFSAWTFTGLAGVGFESGGSMLLIFGAGVTGNLLNALFMARWFRQLRVVTVPEAIRLRFGPMTQQFYAWTSTVVGVLGAAMQLYALAIFCSAVFGFNVVALILVLGVAVLLCATSGGSWAVAASDFLQGVILIPIGVLLAWLCLDRLGGISGMLQAIEAKGLADEYRILALPGEAPIKTYTWIWAAAYFLHASLGLMSLSTGARYFGVKDGREASKAAWLSLALSFTALIFFIPPIAARLLFEADVQAVNINKPGEAAYAVASMKLLPLPLVSIVIVAMCAATMSSMDTGLNRAAAIFTRDIYPIISRFLGKAELTARRALRLGQILTLVLGVIITLLAVYFAKYSSGGVFSAFLSVGSLLTIPLAIPMVLCLFVRRVPSWAAITSVLAALVPSTLGFFSESWFGRTWTYPEQIFWNVSSGAGVFIASVMFFRFSSKSYLERVNEFFRRMKTPVDYTEEVGENYDMLQLRVMGWFSLAIGIFVLMLMVLPGTLAGRLGIMMVGGAVTCLGSVMLFLSRHLSSASSSVESVDSAATPALVECPKKSGSEESPSL